MSPSCHYTYIALFKWPYANASLLSYEIIHMPTSSISPIFPAFFCDFLHVCLINNVITVFIKSHSYAYLIKNLSFIERKPSESYLLIWKKIRLKKGSTPVWPNPTKQKTEGVADICAQMFGCNSGSFRLGYRNYKTNILICKRYKIILNHCNDFHKKNQIL